jgi:hypothetical protein
MGSPATISIASAPARTNLLPKGRTSRRQFLRSRPHAGTGLSPLTAWKPFPWNRSDLACRTIGNGAVYTLGTAAKAAGVSKSTVHRAIRTGKISARSKDGAGYEIDPAEFHRVFPLLSKEVAEQCSDETETGSIERSGTGGVSWKSGSGTAVPVTEHLQTAVRLARAEAELDSLKQVLELERKRAEELRAERDRWAGIAESSQRQITHLAERRRGWWPWRRSA